MSIHIHKHILYHIYLMSQESKASKLIPENVIGSKTSSVPFLSTKDNIITYALAVGFNSKQLKTEDFKFTYEMNDEFQAFPSYSTGIPINSLGDILMGNPNIPDFNPMNLLHGEEYCEFLKPIEANTKLSFTGEVLDYEDKGKGTVLCIGLDIKGEDDSIFAKIKSNIFVKGLKGQGYKSKSYISQLTVPKSVPKTLPNKVAEYQTNENTALYYRLGGNDSNPLHVDPDMSAMGGFEKPILHGLCTYGITCRLVYENYCNGDASNIKSMNARFTSHVIPGETLIVSFWNASNNKIIVSTKTKERGLQVLIAEVELRSSKF